MSKRIYVGNLPYSVDDEALRAMFSTYGEVTDFHVIINRETGRSKGFGFVEMADEKAADEAIKALHDTDAGGRKLVVNEARERKPMEGGMGGGGQRSGGFGQTTRYTPPMQSEKPEETPEAPVEEAPAE